MDERSRFRLFIGIVVSIVVVSVVISVLFVVGAEETENPNSWALAASVATACALALVAALVARRRLREMKSGIPSEDERLIAIKERAGYLSFFMSIYICLGLGSIFGVFLQDETIEVLTVGEIMFLLVAVMGIIYIVTWTVISRGKDGL